MLEGDHADRRRTSIRSCLTHAGSARSGAILTRLLRELTAASECSDIGATQVTNRRATLHHCNAVAQGAIVLTDNCPQRSVDALRRHIDGIDGHVQRSGNPVEARSPIVRTDGIACHARVPGMTTGRALSGATMHHESVDEHAESVANYCGRRISCTLIGNVTTGFGRKGTRPTKCSSSWISGLLCKVGPARQSADEHYRPAIRHCAIMPAMESSRERDEWQVCPEPGSDAI